LFKEVSHVHLLHEFAPAFVAMLFLGLGSGFFSCSEAALFSLQPDERRSLKSGRRSQKIAIGLLKKPDLLLMGILFWNLILNMVYFALASIVSIRLEDEQRHTEAGLVAMIALLAIIVGSEMAPKTLGILAPKLMTEIVSFPLAAAIRLFAPLGPMFSIVSQAIRRVFLPNFEAEPYLQLADLEQAITISTADEELASQERSALHNIVQLSDLRAVELMRPRTQYRVFPPPVHLEHLEGQPTRSGYLLISETDNDEVCGAIPLALLPTIPRNHLENSAQPVVYLPWCTTVAAVFDELRNQNCEVAAILNEFGETIGIITLEDLLHTVFEDQSSRSIRIHQTASIRRVSDHLWHVTGMTSLRRLGRAFQLVLPRSKSTTVGGVVQEILQRQPEKGDEVDWPPFHFRVIEADQFGLIKLELTMNQPAEPQP